MKTISLFILAFNITAWAKASLNPQEKVQYQQIIFNACNLTTSEDNKEEICNCIARNHLAKAPQVGNKSKALAQLQWVADFYSKKLSQEEFQKDPYAVGGASGLIFSFDNECKFDPNYKVQSPISQH